MLKQGTVTQVRRQELPRHKSHIVLAMRRYPRGIRKEWVDAYAPSLSPEIGLFTEFRKFKEQYAHNEAFKKTQFALRFRLDPLGFSQLKTLSDRSRSEDVYLICQCEMGQFCHRELLLLMAEDHFDVPIDQIWNSYP